MINVTVFSLNPFQENTYLLWNEKLNAIIIDPGCYFTAEEETLQNFMNEKNLTPVQLINTHCHIDHIFGNKWVAKTFHLELFIHSNEKQVLEFGPASGNIWGLHLDQYNGPLHFIKESDIINLGDDKLQVIFAPGHSPGSICLYCKEQ